MKMATHLSGMIAGIILLYIFSLGPATAWYYRVSEIDRIEWTADNFKKADRASRFLDKVAPFYEPLSWMNRRSRIFQHALDWYQTLWSPAGEPIVF